MRVKLLGVALAAMALGACKQEQAAPAKPQEGIKVAPTAGGPAAPQAGGQAAVHGAPSAGDTATAAGKVLETMDAGGYTYLRIEAASGEVWAAVRQTAIKPGATVSIQNAMVMRGFTSKTLDRTFDEILFGELGSVVGGADAPAGEMPPGHPPVAAVAPAEGTGGGHGAGAKAEVGEIPKAEGGYTIAELVAKKAELSDKEVAIRGKVTKFNPGIMGRNWVHIQDGSGSPETKDFDLTVTTNDDATIDDVVLIKGKLSLNRDFGAGYSYDLIVEEATLSR
ncbi:MAG: hypothetical protein AMXMBFR64_53930 [Myxococcales bacterium]